MQQQEGALPEALHHPEEMTAEVQLRIGSNVPLSIATRATPTGLIAVGVLVSSIILSVPIVWVARRRQSNSWMKTAAKRNTSA